MSDRRLDWSPEVEGKSMSPLLGVVGSQEVWADGWLQRPTEVTVETRFGKVRTAVGFLEGVEVAFLRRNGEEYPLASHAINYRANAAAFLELGIQKVVATAIVGALRSAIPVGSLVLADQFLDFTRHRQFTYFDDRAFSFSDMTEPYCPDLRYRISMAATQAGIAIYSRNACYVCTDGPRFETRAEVNMYAHLGGDIIGMTAVPECVMAREVGICYSTIAGIVNLGAGIERGSLDADDWHGMRRSHAQRFRELVSRTAGSLVELPNSIIPCKCHQAASQQTERLEWFRPDVRRP